jgi:uncharacterized protein
MTSLSLKGSSVASVRSDLTPASHLERPGLIPVKLVIAGGFAVGKTTFVASISDITPLTTEAAMTTVAADLDDRGQVSTKTTTTVAMDFGKVAIDDKIVLYLFGTPGQDRFGFMWDDLISGALGAIVLIDSRRLTDSFPALDYFESRDVPFVAAVNLFDGTTVHKLEDVRETLDIGPEVPLIGTDARNRAAVKTSLLTLVNHVLERAYQLSAI